MANIIYAKSSGVNDAALGKLETPIKMYIEKESDKYEKKSSFLKKVYNIEKSNNFGETITAQSSFGPFQAMKEGQGPENDSVGETYRKFIEHITFGKEFTITKEMVEDAKLGVASNLKRQPRMFVEAYYKTMEQIGAQALIHGTGTSMTYGKATVDLSTYDGLPLFHKSHKFYTPAMAKKSQGNYFYGDITSSASVFEEALAILANKQRNMLDENGEPLEYISDTILIPSNRPKLEMMVKKVVGTERAAGSDWNDINTQYGNWNLVVVPGWRCETDKIMVMSSEANKNLQGNMFFNRVPLTINNWQDNHTWNYIWNGRCRFGVGFGTYKHILLCDISANGDGNSEKLA